MSKGPHEPMTPLVTPTLRLVVARGADEMGCLVAGRRWQTGAVDSMVA